MTFALGTTAGAGTVSVAAGGTTVTGVGTNFTSANVGAILVVGAQWGAITAVASTTSITIDRAFTTAVSGATYSVSGNYPVITQSGTDTTLAAFNTLAGVSNLSLGDARIYQPASAMLNVTGTLTIPGLTEKLVFDNQTDTAVGGTQRDHDIQVSGTLNINLSSVSNGTTIYAPDFVYLSRRPAPSGGGGEHQLNTTGSSFYVTPTGTANLTGGTYVTQFNFACDTGGRLNVTGSHLKGRGNRFWMKTGSITTFQNCTIEGFSIFFNAFPTTISGVTFKQCSTITKEITYNGGFDSAPNVVLAPTWLATSQPIINIWGGAWLRVKNASGGSSLGVLNTAITPWHSGIADFHQDVSFTTKDLAGAAVIGFKFWATESNDGNRRNVQQYTGVGPFFNNTDIRTMLFTTSTGGVSNSIEMRLQAGVTTITPTATPGSGGLVTTNYGQTSSDEYDFYGIGYNYALSQNRIQCRANGALSIATVALPDLLITQSNMATVAAYTTLNTGQEFYDFAKYFLYTNFAGQTATYVSRSGNVINAGAYNVIIDATASTPFALSGNTITIKSSTFTGSITTTGTVTLANGAVLSGSTITANVLQATPAGMTGVTINGSLTHNTNTPVTVTDTNNTISGIVSNTGSALVTRNLINSTFGTVGANVITRPVTSLNINGLTAGSQVCVFNGSGAVVEYVASSGTSYTRDTTGQTGTWSYKVARYGFTAQTGLHSPATASTILAVTLLPDLFVTQPSASVVAAYEYLPDNDKLYDYSAYYETTNEGIKYARVITKAGTSPSAGSYPVTLNETGDLWIFNGSSLSVFAGFSISAGVTITGPLYTSSTVTVPAGINNTAINANVLQTDPSDLSGMTITGDLTYGTSAPFGLNVTFTDCVITGAVSNSGTADIIITKQNTTIGAIGAHVTAQQFATISAPNLLSGSRVRVFNVTDGIEMFNGVLSSAGFSESFLYTGNKTVTLTATCASGMTAKLGLSTTGIFTATGVTFLSSQADDTVYNIYGVDGSSVNGFAADYINTEVNLTLAGDFYATEMYAWWCHNLTTESGIRNFFGGIDAVDAGNIRINRNILNLYIDNISSSLASQNDEIRIFASDGVRPARAVTSGGGGIDMNWKSIVYVTGVDLSSVAKESTSQAIKANTDLIPAIKNNTGLIPALL